MVYVIKNLDINEFVDFIEADNEQEAKEKAISKCADCTIPEAIDVHLADKNELKSYNKLKEKENEQRNNL